MALVTVQRSPSPSASAETVRLRAYLRCCQKYLILGKNAFIWYLILIVIVHESNFQFQAKLCPVNDMFSHYSKCLAIYTIDFLLSNCTYADWLFFCVFIKSFKLSLLIGSYRNFCSAVGRVLERPFDQSLPKIGGEVDFALAVKKAKFVISGQPLRPSRLLSWSTTNYMLSYLLSVVAIILVEFEKEHHLIG